MVAVGAVGCSLFTWTASLEVVLDLVDLDLDIFAREICRGRGSETLVLLRSMSRTEDRKAARMAKKQRRVEHFQRYRENLKLQRAGQVKSTLIDKKEKVNKYTPPKKTEISDEESPSDEEILSDEMISDVEMEKKENKEKKIKKEKKLKKEKKAKKEKKQSFDEGFDFMSMIDEAFDSGKLTKEGFADSEESDFDFNVSDSEEEEYESEEEEGNQNQSQLYRGK